MKLQHGRAACPVTVHQGSRQAVCRPFAAPISSSWSSLAAVQSRGASSRAAFGQGCRRTPAAAAALLQAETTAPLHPGVAWRQPPPPISQPWFEAAIQTAVKHIGPHPLLIVVDATPGLSIRALQLTPEQADVRWPVLQASLGISSSSATLLVQPVPGPEDVCAAASGNCPLGGDTPSSSACPQATATDAAAEVIAGKVGDCCDDGAATAAGSSSRSAGSHSTTQHAASNGHQRLSPASTASSSSSDHSSGEHAFYGVVVQSQLQPHLQGCYLLKVSRQVHRTASSSGCACTHYCLNRVCQNVPLARQYLDSWLA